MQKYPSSTIRTGITTLPTRRQYLPFPKSGCGATPPRTFEKRSYRLNFVDEEGLDNPVAVMGMDAHSDWALYGPSLDKSLIRNYMWYNISGEIMAWAPNVRYCELILNGEYEGLYLMVETITNGNDCRLDLSDQAYGTSVTGYLLRSDPHHRTQIWVVSGMSIPILNE